jgi:F-type H+-transporting ATPase subunit delta
MKDATLPKIYAEALLQLAIERNDTERVREDVVFLSQLPRAQGMMRAFFDSPRIVGSEKAKVLDHALRGRLTDTVVNFVLLVVRKGRAIYLRDMLEQFLLVHDRRVGLLHAVATSAVPLGQPAADALKQALEAKLKKRVEVHNKVDPEILGGLVVRYEGMVADGSLKSALVKIAAGMKSAKFGSQLVHEN